MVKEQELTINFYLLLILLKGRAFCINLIKFSKHLYSSSIIVHHEQ